MENTINKSNNELTRKDAHEILTEGYASMYGIFLFFSGVMAGLSLSYLLGDSENKYIVGLVFIIIAVGLAAYGSTFKKQLKTRVMEMIKEIK